MVWKESTNTTSQGDAAKFGAANINKMAQLFNGNTDVDTVTINSPFTVQNGKLIVATITNTGTITLPTSTTTLVGRNTTDTLTNKTFDDQIDSKVISIPSDPSSGYVRVYAKQIDSNNDGLFIKVKKAGAVVEVQIA
jgi:hypothetical protein